jgi:hypothetical protein
MDMTETDFARIYDQLAELVRGLRTLATTAELRHDQAAGLHDLIRYDLATLRGDHKDLEEKLDCVILVVQHDLEEFRIGAIAGARAVNALTSAVQELKGPVAEIVAIRSRVAGLILGFGIIGSALVWLAEPIYRWVVELHFSRH